MCRCDFLLLLCESNGLFCCLCNSCSFQSGNLNNFAAQFLAQLIDMYHITILGNDIHHVYCHDYRNTKFHDLCRKI